MEEKCFFCILFILHPLPMKKLLSLIAVSAIFLLSCQKKVDNAQPVTPPVVNEPADTAPTVKEFIPYLILQGQQYSNLNAFVRTSYEQLSFAVKFDSSAIYQTLIPSNQGDINKLYGFSDNNAQHHEFSARFGWRWSKDSLRLFAYVYNNSQMSFKEIGTVQIGTENSCSIKVAGDNYIFTLNETTLTMPRASSTVRAEGYKLYPYFGGDELAPHTICIWIKEL